MSRASQIFSPESRAKISASLSGRKDSIESRMKKSAARQGSKNPAWKGGEARARRSRYKTLEYSLWRESVFEQDKFSCQFPECKQIGGKIEAHHIKLYSEYPELRFVTSNGVTLCKRHHRMIRQYESDIEYLFILK